MPDFTTTTDSDRAVAAVLMMGAMQKYFSYGARLKCGIPSVTLLGEREDWEKIHNRLNKLFEFGDEPTNFAKQLRPIVRNLVSMFDADAQSNPELQAFWGRIANKHSMGSGPTWFSGWITTFCMWHEDGKLINRIRDDQGLELDGVRYGRIDIKKIPAGFVSVPIKVDDNGVEYNTKMVAGSFGVQAMSSGQRTDPGNEHAYMRYDGEDQQHEPASGTEEPGLESLQPVTGWIMYEVRD